MFFFMNLNSKNIIKFWFFNNYVLTILKKRILMSIIEKGLFSDLSFKNEKFEKEEKSSWAVEIMLQGTRICKDFFK